MHVRLYFRLASVPVFGPDGVPLRAAVVDETTWLPAGIQKRLCRFASALEEHLGVMFIAKRVKVFFRTGTQPFLLTCCVGDRHLGVAISRAYVQFAAHWRRGHLRAALSHGKQNT